MCRTSLLTLLNQMMGRLRTRFFTFLSTAVLPVLALSVSVVGLILVQSGVSFAGSEEPVPKSAETKFIKFGRLWDGRAVIKDATVVVEGDRILRIDHGAVTVPDNADFEDLSGYTGIPGLIDVHTHMTYYWDGAPGTRPWSALDNMTSPEIVFLAQKNARRSLEAGVTAVRDLGAFDPAGCVNMDIVMRDLINSGEMTGPRMFVCGFGLLSTYAPGRPGFSYPRWGFADGPSEVMRAVREQVAAGADWIKMFASTGTGDDVTGYQTFTYDEIKAAVEVAHGRGKRIALHSYGPEAARDAVRAGADTIEHATDMDDDTIRDMVKRKTFYVPTIDHNRYYVENREHYGYTEEAATRMTEFIERNLETTRRARAAGVRIAMGSDAVFTMFGENVRELAWFVKAGMSPEEALKTATVNAAELLGMERELGRVAPGYYADLVAIEGDPVSDIDSVINGVIWVMKGGRVVVDAR